MHGHALAEVLYGTPLGPIIFVVAARMHAVPHDATNSVARGLVSNLSISFAKPPYPSSIGPNSFMIDDATDLVMMFDRSYFDCTHLIITCPKFTTSLL